MLEQLFLQVLSLSFTGGTAVLVVLAARLALKRAPKAYSYALWAVVLFRLVCPFSFESVWSLLPANPQPVSQGVLYADILRTESSAAVFDGLAGAALPAATSQAGVDPVRFWVGLGAVIWCAGIALLLAYSLLSLHRLNRRLQGARHERDNIWYSGLVDTAFVLGVLRPRIVLPSGLSEKETGYILLHEQTHIQRRDPLIKLFSFLTLCVHWFNPLVWAAFFLSAKDMEMACDEAVIKRLGKEVKKEYSASLLALATGRRIVGGTPLAFGEGDTKGRVKNVLNYKKPAFWIVIIASALVAAVGIGLAANPKKPFSSENTIASANLPPAQKAEIAARYQLGAGSNIFETKFHVSDNIKSYAYYVELYQRGTKLGTVVQMHGSLDAKEGSVFSAFSMNRGANGHWESMRWTAGMPDGSFSAFPAIPFPDGFAAQGVSTAALTNEGNPGEMPKILPEQPVIVANIGLNTAEKSEISAYSCTYLMEHPEKIAEYACVYLVKCVFSEKDETELAQALFSDAGTDKGGYLTTFELYNSKGGILQSSYSLTPQVAAELPALLLKGGSQTSPSVDDVPQGTEEYLKITIGDLSDRVYFVYASNGRFWVEKPYDYKRELDKETYSALMEYLATQPSGPPVAGTDGGLDASVPAFVLD